MSESEGRGEFLAALATRSLDELSCLEYLDASELSFRLEGRVVFDRPTESDRLGDEGEFGVLEPDGGVGALELLVEAKGNLAASEPSDA